MDRLYNVTIEYMGLKKRHTFKGSTICMGKDGSVLVMDSEGKTIRFVANNCKVEQIAAHVIIIHGFTDKPRHITAYCIYSNVTREFPASPPVNSTELLGKESEI